MAEEPDMEQKLKAVVRQAKRMKRELTIWRVLAVVVAAAFTAALAQEKTPKEIRLVSADRRQTVLLSANGLEFSAHGKTLGRIGFDGVGDSDDLEVGMKLSGHASALTVSVQDGKNRAMLKTESITFLQNGALRSQLTPDGLFLQDVNARTKITLTTPQQGLGGLDFIERGNLVLSLGALGKFRGGDAPRRDAGAIVIGDFGPAPKSRLITATESELHGTH
jgi:hypothetical protein